MIRVVIADDHHLVREGIRALLEKTDDIQVVGEATDGLEAIERTVMLKPDVVLMDIAMPRLNGVRAVERIRAAEAGSQVVILSMYSDEALIRQAFSSGACGFLLKGSVSAELLLAIRAASHGATYLSPAVSDSLLGDEPGNPRKARGAADSATLTEREIEVLRLIADGRTNSQIAQTMGISTKTVERHRTNLMAKLEVHNLAGLLRVAAKKGLIRLDD